MLFRAAADGHTPLPQVEYDDRTDYTPGLLIGGSTLLMGANGVVEVIHSIRAGESQGFRPLCEEESPS